ncbi:hypothetical protein DFH28DRAFT_931396 [Melampsora americana]|nr:hypothetical protein DFH28DRAFT_931396 [Melampsora americana]
MVQATLLRSLIFSSVFCMVLCLDNAPTPPPKDGLFPDAAASKRVLSDSITNSTAIPTLGSSMGSNSTHQPDSSTIPGVLSADGKCTCPGVPPVSGGPPAINSSDETGSTSTPGPADNATAVSTNDTSSTSFIKAPTNLCLLAISAVVGFNSLIA